MFVQFEAWLLVMTAATANLHEAPAKVGVKNHNHPRSNPNPQAVSAERIQARLQKIAIETPSLKGSDLSSFLHEKFIRPASSGMIDIPSFKFYDKDKVIITSAQGLFSEYVKYFIKNDRFCLIGTKYDFGCFQIFTQKSGLPILKMGDGSKSRYILVTAIKE